MNYDVLNSGYGDDKGQGAKDELYADLEALDGHIDQNSMWLMRLHAELPRSALAEDLTIGASMNQSPAERFFQATLTIGTAPSCPPQPQCPDPPDTGNDDSWGGYFGSESQSGGGCTMTNDPASSAALGGLTFLAALALSRRRRSRSW